MKASLRLLAAALLVGAGPSLSFAQERQAAAGPPLELGFSEAVRMAGETPAGVILSRERVLQALDRIGQARSGLLPQLSTAASQARQTRNLKAQGFSLPGTGPLIGPFNTFDARIRLTQSLFDAETLENLKVARLGRDLAAEQERKARQDAMALVAVLYVEAQRAQEGIALARVQADRDRREWHVARIRFEVGAGSRTAADEAGARFAQSRRFLASKRAEAVQRRLDLLSALGLPVDRDIAFKEDLQSLLLPAPTGPTDGELEAHPDVAVARGEVEQRRAQAAAVRAGYAPQLSADADYGGSGVDPSDLEGTYQFGVRFSLPLFEGGRRREKVKEAGHQLQESETRLEDARLQTRARVLRSMESVRESWAAVEAGRTSFRVAEEELDLARDRFGLGMGTQVEWTEQAVRRAQAKDDLEEAIAAYQIARVGLAQALGRMEDLGAKGAGQQRGDSG